MAKNLVWIALVVVALFVIGSIVVSVLGLLLKLVLYVAIGAAVLGGGLYLVGRARRGIGSRRQLP